MTTTLDNLLDQALDIRGSISQTQTQPFADEPAGLGAALTGQTGVAASMAAAGGGQIVVTGLTGMTAASVGQFLTVSGAATGANNDTFLIEVFNSATSVTISDNGTAPGTDANNGSLVWTERMVDGSVGAGLALLGFASLLVGELAERRLFLRAEAARAMPGPC